MPKIQINGIDEIGIAFANLQKDSTGILKQGVYNGAHLVYEEVEKNIKNLPTSKSNTKPPRNITEEQKKGLLDSLYGSRIMEENNLVYLVISVTGYNDLKTKFHPKGQPNIEILRSLEHGASYMTKHAVMRTAAANAKKKAIEAVQKTVTDEINKNFK